jgi:solute carrier family 39 (zinc transporter), member 1/2/3
MAYMFELGCIFHSVIIGITLGVLTGQKSDVSICGLSMCVGCSTLLSCSISAPRVCSAASQRAEPDACLFPMRWLQVVAMLIALAFHQLLEGIALSSFIIDASVGMVKGVIMIVIYALTSPVGIAIGIGISKSYNENSVTAKAVQVRCLRMQ